MSAMGSAVRTSGSARRASSAAARSLPGARWTNWNAVKSVSSSLGADSPRNSGSNATAPTDAATASSAASPRRPTARARVVPAARGHTARAAAAVNCNSSTSPR